MNRSAPEHPAAFLKSGAKVALFCKTVRFFSQSLVTIFLFLRQFYVEKKK
jgi:hypothetical protein